MILERRAYTLRPGTAADFWELQARYCDTPAMKNLLSHTVCYFETVAGPAEQIVHLHHFADLGAWEDTYAVLYRDHPSEYFVRARALLVAQETMFLRAMGPWALADVPRPLGPVADVVEERFDLYPGTASRFPLQDQSDLLGTYLSFVGRLHRVLRYRLDSARIDTSAMGETGGLAEITRSSGRTLLRPSPVGTHRRLFEA